MTASSELREALMQKLQFNPDIDIACLSREMSRIASHIYHIGTVKAQAEKNVDRAIAKLDLIKAQVSRRAKDKALEAGDKLTVSETEAIVMMSKKTIEAGKKLIDLKYKLNVCKAAFSSAQSKANQLTNLSMNYRKELDAGINSRVKEGRVKTKVSRRV